MTSVLAEKTCTPCRGGTPPLTAEEAEAYRVQAPEWLLQDEARRIERTYRFRNFTDAFAFVRGAGELAETEFHHPDINFGWGYTTVPAGILAVSLHRHRLERVAYVPRLQQLHRKPSVSHPRIEPLRQRTSLQSNPYQIDIELVKPANECLGLAGNLCLPHDPSGRIHYTHARAFQRHVDPRIVFHGRPSMMLGAGSRPAPVNDTITLRDGHPCHLARQPARYPI